MNSIDDTDRMRGDFPVRDDDICSDFKYEVAQHVGGEGVLRCLKCGACSGACPVGSVIDYRPRKVLGNVLLGLKDQVLTGNSLWMCAACFTCEERCVQKVNFTDVVTALRNMASHDGNAPKGYVSMAKTVMENGRVSRSTHQVEKLREQLRLPQLKEPDIEQLGRIMDLAGFKEVIHASEGGDEE